MAGRIVVLMITFSFACESSGDSTQLIYLRARQYSPGMGRFLTRDKWDGNYNRPLSLNKWLYVEDNSVNNTDPSGLCIQDGWHEPSGGLFSEENCKMLEQIYLDASGDVPHRTKDLQKMEDWYSKLADAIQRDGNTQAAANIRHFLDGTGTPLQLSTSFMQNDLWGWDYINKEVNKLTTWYVRSQIPDLEGCQPTQIVPSGYARQIETLTSHGYRFGAPPSVAGALGNFRLDVVISGNLHKLSNWSSKTETQLNLQIIVLDYYDWEKGKPAPVLVSGKVHEVPDDWALLLSRRGYAKSFFIRGDLNVTFTDTVKGQFLKWPVGSKPPSGWYKSSCVGINFLQKLHDQGNYPYPLEQIGYPFGACAPGPF